MAKKAKPKKKAASKAGMSTIADEDISNYYRITAARDDREIPYVPDPDCPNESDMDNMVAPLEDGFSLQVNIELKVNLSRIKKGHLNQLLNDIYTVIQEDRKWHGLREKNKTSKLGWDRKVEDCLKEHPNFTQGQVVQRLRNAKNDEKKRSAIRESYDRIQLKKEREKLFKLLDQRLENDPSCIDLDLPPLLKYLGGQPLSKEEVQKSFGAFNEVGLEKKATVTDPDLPHSDEKAQGSYSVYEMVKVPNPYLIKEYEEWPLFIEEENFRPITTFYNFGGKWLGKQTKKK